MNSNLGHRTVNQQIRLNNGQMVSVRHAQVSDTELFLRFFAGLSAKSREFMHGWSADNACNLDHAHSLAAKTHADDHCALVVLDGAPPHERIVGYCWSDRIGNKDAIPMLGIGVIDEYHEMGMGKALLLLMIEHARTLGLDRVKLGVWDDNPRAIHVYEAVGFQTAPTLAAKDFDGRTEIYMVVRTGRDS